MLSQLFHMFWLKQFPTVYVCMHMHNTLLQGRCSSWLLAVCKWGNNHRCKQDWVMSTAPQCNSWFLVLSAILQLSDLVWQKSTIPFKSPTITNHICCNIKNLHYLWKLWIREYVLTDVLNLCICKDTIPMSVISLCNSYLFFSFRCEVFKHTHAAIHHCSDPLWWVWPMNVAHSLQWVSLRYLFPRLHPSRMPISIT